MSEEEGAEADAAEAAALAAAAAHAASSSTAAMMMMMMPPAAAVTTMPGAPPQPPPASSSVEAAAADLVTECQVNVPFEEFQDDVEHRLGRANGNVHVRRQGLEGVHDGQIMVRLKRKRFVILDYGIVPNESDVLYADATPHVKVLDGAGRRKCTTSACTKIGVPVCLWDSEPEEVDSLYLRSGMCFTCQRNLNEKRRTERKRAVPAASVPPTAQQAGRLDGFVALGHEDDGTAGEGGGAHSVHGVPSLIYAIGPAAPKRFKTMSGGGGGILELTHDAVIINAPSDLLAGFFPPLGGGGGVGDPTATQQPAFPAHADLHHQQQHFPQNQPHLEPSGEGGPGAAAEEDGRGAAGSSGAPDASGGGWLLRRSTREALADVERLVASSGEEEEEGDHHRHRGGGIEGSSTTSAVAAAAAVAAASAAAAEGGGEASHHLSAEAAASAVHLVEHDGSSSLNRDAAAGAAAAPNVQALYETSLKSLLRSVYLLHQWKTSWDAAVETVSDPNFADAVASAAAVAAAAAAAAGADASEDSTSFGAAAAAAGPPAPEPLAAHAPHGGNDPLGSSMVSLLLAADDKQRQIGEGGGEHHPDVQLEDDDRGSGFEGLSSAHPMLGGGGDDDDAVQEV